MIDAREFNHDEVYIHAENFCDAIFHVVRNIAYPDDLLMRSVLQQSFRHDARRIGKVNQPCFGTNLMNIAGDIQHKGNCAQSFKHAARPVCFLADQAVAERNFFV